MSSGTSLPLMTNRSPAGDEGAAGHRRPSRVVGGGRSGPLERLREVRLDSPRSGACRPSRFSPTPLLATWRASGRPPSTGSFLSAALGERGQEDFGPAFVSEIVAYCAARHCVGVDVSDEPTSLGPPPRTDSRDAGPGKKGPTSNALQAFPFSRSAAAARGDRVETGGASSRRSWTIWSGTWRSRTRATSARGWMKPMSSVCGGRSKSSAWRLKPIFLHLEEQVSYNVIRVVIAAERAAGRDG